MKQLTLLLFLFSFQNLLFAQCPSDDVIFTNQGEVNEFKQKFPACQNITTNLVIDGTDIVDLSTLENLTSVEGNLTIKDCKALEVISIFKEVKFIGGNLQILNNPSLRKIDAFENLDKLEGGLLLENNENLEVAHFFTKIASIKGDIFINKNPSLLNIEAFVALQNFEYDFNISNCPKLEMLPGIENIGNFKNLTIENCGIKDLTGLNGITHLNGNLSIIGNLNLDKLSFLSTTSTISGNLVISGNPQLLSVIFLKNINSIAGKLEISYNNSLQSLEGLGNIAPDGISFLTVKNCSNLKLCFEKNLCQYLSNGGKYEIINNAGVCNNSDSFKENCSLDVRKIYSIKSGNWNSPTTWFGNTVPKSNDSIIVKPSHTVVINIPVAYCKSLLVEQLGVLELNDSLILKNDFTNLGTINCNKKSNIVLNTFKYTNNGLLQLSQNSTFVINGNTVENGTIAGLGKLKLEKNKKHEFTPKSVFKGECTIENLDQTITFGQLLPGDSLGVLSVFANLDLTKTNLEIDLKSDKGIGLGHDQIRVKGRVIIGGTLKINLLGGFQPRVKSKFALMTADEFSSSKFSQIIIPDFITDYTLNVENGNLVLQILATKIKGNLLAFKVFADKKQMLINWEVDESTKFTAFELQRSQAAKNWEKIAIVDKENTPNQYFHLDVPPTSGTWYYRLKMIDYKGDFIYSGIQADRIIEQNEVAIYPTVAKSGDDWKIKCFQSSEVLELDLYNSSGQFLQHYSFDDCAAVYLSTDQLQSGTYFAIVKLENKFIRIPLVYTNF